MLFRPQHSYDLGWSCALALGIENAKHLNKRATVAFANSGAGFSRPPWVLADPPLFQASEKLRCALDLRRERQLQIKTQRDLPRSQAALRRQVIRAGTRHGNARTILQPIRSRDPERLSANAAGRVPKRVEAPFIRHTIVLVARIVIVAWFPAEAFPIGDVFGVTP